MALARGNNASYDYDDVSSWSETFDRGTADRTVLVANLHMSDVNGSNPTFNTPTIDSSDMTLQASDVHTYAGGARTQRAEVWTFEAPASGNVTFAGGTSVATDDIHIGLDAWTDAGAPGNSNAGPGGNNNSYALAITSASSSNVLVGMVGGVTRRDWAMSTGTDTHSIDLLSGDMAARGGYEAATGGADTWDVSASTAVRGNAAAVEMVEDLGAGGGANPHGPLGHPLHGPFGGPIGA